MSPSVYIMGTNLLRNVRNVADGKLISELSSTTGRRSLNSHCRSSQHIKSSLRTTSQSNTLFYPWMERFNHPYNQFNKHRRYLASFSDRILDIVQSKSFTPTNPLSDSISQGYQNLDFPRLMPHHFNEAVTQYQTEYDRRLKSLENDIISGVSILTYENVVIELDRIVRPLLYLKNVIVLLSMVKSDENFSATYEKIELKHEKSSIIFNALTRIEQDLLSSRLSLKERIRVVQSLLKKSKLMGLDSNIQSELAQITSRITQLESKFHTLSSFTMEEHGKVTSPRELLPYMYKILALKKQRSEIMGYESNAEMNLDMHNSTAKSIDIIRPIHDLFAKHAKEKMGSQEFIPNELDLKSDMSFLHDVRSNFELNHVLDGLFEFCSSLFGIKIVEELQKDKINGWNRDVRLFHVYDISPSSRFDNEVSANPPTLNTPKLSSFYLDPYRRRHKSSECFVTPISYRHGVSNDDSSESIVAICLNIKPAVWDNSPVYIDIQDVVTLFHEFGHALQHLLADSELGFLCGTQCVEEDTSEVVSQFMEYWFFEGPLLSKLSKNPETGELLSPEAVQKIKRWRSTTKLQELYSRLFLGELELEINSNFDPLGDDSIVSLQRKYAEIFSPLQVPPKGNIDPLIEIFQNNAKGKCSVQYRYLWSEIMSADAFEEFLEVDGLNALENVRNGVGERFRRKFLEAGNRLSLMDAFREFRGRDATMEPLLKRYGLAS